jgi:hypothetical protein
MFNTAGSTLIEKILFLFEIWNIRTSLHAETTCTCIAATSLRTNVVDLNGVTTQPPHVNTLMYICQCYGTLYQVNQEVIAESTYKSLMNFFFVSR